jgi:hypothetical protein
MSGIIARTTVGDVLFAEGFLGAIACAPDTMSREEVEAHVRANHPCGTTGGWMLDEDQESLECDDVPGRKHYVFTC